MDEFSFLKTQVTPPKNDFRILVIIEDDPIFRKAIARFCAHKWPKRDILIFNGPQEFFEKSKTLPTSPLTFLTDLSFSNESIDGLQFIERAKQLWPTSDAIMMTGFSSIESAIEATKKGVGHYLTKPFDLNDLVGPIEELDQKACEDIGAVEKANQDLYSPAVIISKQNGFEGMIGESKEMHDVFEKVRRVAHSDSTALIHGASGTGKELVAKAIHKLSARGKGPMVSINCGAIPGDLLESELFGHKKGSFTGALSDRRGRFQQADGGTLFLDEIGDMPLVLQVKILRALQAREVVPVGSDIPLPVNVRVIAATHRDLEKEMANGNFREDLYYRLNVIPIILPSLHLRKSDIPILIGHFLKRFASVNGKNHIRFSTSAMEVLQDYSWPGNVRELENLLERLIILKGGGIIRAKDLPERILQEQKKVQDSQHIGLPTNGLDLRKTLKEIERSLIEQALGQTHGNKNKASQLLKLNRTTLIEKMKKWEEVNHR